MLVLKRATRTTKIWGPRWLAILLSSSLKKFGKFWLNYSDNAEETLKAGIFGPGSQYLMAWHPHGAFTVAATYFLSNYWARSYPGGGTRFVCIAPLLLRIPFLSEFLLLCNARSADRKTFDSLLKSGATVAVQPGGLKEQVYTDASQERIFIPSNLGFVRLALAHGTPLLPTYAFGENQLYNTGPKTIAFNTWLYKKFRIGNLIVLGQGGIPTTPILPNPLMLPGFRRGLHVRFGEPVEVGKPDPNPSEERVLEVFEEYKKAIRCLFDAHKDACLPPDVAAKGLEIVWSPPQTKKSTSLDPALKVPEQVTGG